MSAVGDPLEQGAVERFEFPLIEAEFASNDGNGKMLTAGQTEALHKRAYQDGFDAGHGDGYKAGLAMATDEIAKREDMLDNLLQSLVAPLHQLDSELVENVADLAILISRLLVRRELKTEPGEVVGVVRETLKQLPVANRSTSIRLNPEDLDIVRSALSLGDEFDNWRLDADPLLSRGGCVVETESSRIDASVENRLAAIVAQMFGGDRESDREAEG